MFSGEENKPAGFCAIEAKHDMLVIVCDLSFRLWYEFLSGKQTMAYSGHLHGAYSYIQILLKICLQKCYKYAVYLYNRVYGVKVIVSISLSFA